jgi:hypothetical protein
VGNAEENAPKVDLSKDFNAGKKLAQGIPQVTSPNASALPAEFKADCAPESALSEPQLSKVAEERKAGNEAWDFLVMAQKSKGEIPVKHTDADIVIANHAVEHPEEVLSLERETFVEGGGSESKKTKLICEEGGEPYVMQAKRNLFVVVAEKRKIALEAQCTLSLYMHYWWGNEWWYCSEKRPHVHGMARFNQQRDPIFPGQEKYVCFPWFDPVLSNYFQVSYRYERVFPGEEPQAITEAEYNAPLGEADIRENWISETATLEEKVACGECVHVEKFCSQGPATRMINNQPISRDCWQETIVYACKNDTPNTCQEWRDKGCVQVNSECVAKQDDRCVKFRQTLICEAKKDGLLSRLTGENKPFCLDGDCDEHKSAVNGDFADAMAKLSIFKEMAKEFDSTNLTIFKGRDSRCSRDCASFRDCCGGSKGWGTSMGLARCDAQEKALFQERMMGKCHEIGEYCAEKVLGVCIRKKRTYCCFQTKLARIVNEQGRAQLGIGWGSPENPLCRGLSIEEMQRIDFSKINLQELFADVYARTKIPEVPQPDLQKLTNEIAHKWETKQLPPSDPSQKEDVSGVDMKKFEAEMKMKREMLQIDSGDPGPEQTTEASEENKEDESHMGEEARDAL